MMPDPEHTADLVVNVTEDADVSVVIVRASRLLSAHGASAPDRTRILTVCSELARNILRYGVHGFIAVSAIPSERGVCVVVDAVDHGPGIADIEAALRDHYSTGGSLGLGLPGASRLMDHLHIANRASGGAHVRAERTIRPLPKNA